MNFDFSHINFKKGLTQIPDLLKALASTPHFIQKHQLWRGFFENGGVLFFSVIIAIAFSYILYGDIYDYFFPSEEIVNIELSTEEINELDEELQELEKALDELPTEAQEDIEEAKQSIREGKEQLQKKHKPLFSGSLKFLLLIFLEVLIFHFSVRTNNILKKEQNVVAFKGFYNAQIRMIKVLFRKWLYSLLMYIFISIACGFLGISFLRDFIMFFVYSFYFGFAFLDNYLEQYHYTIEESARCVQRHFGAATTLGITSSLLVSIPIIGPLIIPFVCGIAATRYAHYSEMELSKEQLPQSIPSEIES